MTPLQTIIVDLFLAICFVESESSKILVMSMHGSSSHLGSMLPYVYNLAQAGHSITILQTNGQREATNFGRGIKTEHIYIPDNIEQKEARSKIWWRNSPTSNLVISIYNVIGDKSLQRMLKHDSTTLGRIMNTSWDLIICDELFTVHGYGIATYQNQRNRTPYIIFSPSLMFYSNFVINSLGRCSVCRMPMSLSSTTELAYEPTKFAHRVGSAFEHITEYIALRYFTQWFGMPHLYEIGVSNFEWIKFFEGASALLGDSLINIPHPTPQGTEMVNVGSVCTEPSGPLSPDMETFLNDPASKGTILVAFGSHVNWRTAPKFLIGVFFETLMEFTDYRIVFAYNAPIKNVPKHFKIIPFAPQKQILNHNRTKIFISHSGLKSMKESICAQVPLLLMPIFAEQAHNALIAYQLGIAETLNKRSLTKQFFTKQLTKLLVDQKYIENMKRVKGLWLDRVIPAMDHGLFITEKILKNPRKPINFNRKGIHIAWIQFVYIDLLIILLFAVAVVYN